MVALAFALSRWLTPAPYAPPSRRRRKDRPHHRDPYERWLRQRARNAIAVVQSVEADGNGVSSLGLGSGFGANITSGNLLVLFGQTRSAVSSVADSGGRTWTQYLNTNIGFSPGKMFTYSAPVGTGGTKPTVTVTLTSGAFVTLFLLEISGSDTSSTPFSTNATGLNSNSGGAVINAGPTGSSGANELCLGAGFCDGGDNVTVDASFSAIIANTTANLKGAVGSKAANSTTISATFTLASQNFAGLMLVILKNASAGGETGTVVATAKKATAALAGAQLYTGTVAATAKKATASLQGVMQPSGTVSATAKKATAALIAQQIYTGTVVATAKKATAALTAAQIYTGTIAATAKKATAALVGVMQPSGTIAATAKQATAALTAAQIYTGSIAATAKKATAALAGTTGATTGTIVATAKKAVAALLGTSTTLLATIPATTNFSTLQSSNATYATARLSGTTTINRLEVGQWLSPDYHVEQGFVEFDTSAIASDATLTTVIMRVNTTSLLDTPGGNFVVQAYGFDYGASVSGADWQDPTEIAGLTLLATYDLASGFTGPLDFVSTGDFLAYLNRSGFTRIVLVSSLFVTGVAPTDDQMAFFAAFGVTPDIDLIVAYAIAPFGTIAATAKKARAALTGSALAGTIAATAKKATAALAGKQVYTGTIAATAKKATAVLRGSFTGTIAATAKPATASLRAFFEHVHGNPPGWGIARASMLPAGVARFTRLRGGHVVATILRRGGGSAHLPREDDQP